MAGYKPALRKETRAPVSRPGSFIHRAKVHKTLPVEQVFNLLTIKTLRVEQVFNLLTIRTLPVEQVFNLLSGRLQTCPTQRNSGAR